MNILPDEIIKLITKYLPCKSYSNFYLTTNYFYKLFENNKCCFIKYLPTNIFLSKLETCYYHGNKDIVNVICELNNAKYKYNTKKNVLNIHFNNQNSLKLAKPYLHSFGEIERFCCDNTGVVYKSKQQLFFPSDYII